MRNRGLSEETDMVGHVKRLMFFMINSTIIYILAYLVAYLEFQTITLIFARMAGIRGDLYYYEIFYATSSSWNALKIIFVNSPGPFISLATGIVILFFLKRSWRRLSPCFKLLFLWTGFHCFNFFMGGIVSGTVTGLGFGYAIDYILKRPVFLYFFLDLVALTLIIIFGYNYARSFVGSAPSVFWAKEINRSRYLFFSAVVPWLFGSAFLFFVKYPDNEPQHALIVIHDLILSITMGLAAVAMLFNKRHFKVRVKASSKEKERKIHLGFAVAAMMVILLFRLILTRSFYSLFA